MERANGTCPLDAALRASRCAACCEANELPPCVTSWLKARTSAAPVVMMRAEAPKRRAA
ncbi:MAG: hypothetical protein HUU14_10800 [Dehalococcoidia bacterium]|nr:hypothetical protein [Dehalococcoidia bacterium]